MAEFRDISLFDIVTNISISEAQERYIQISASNRISLYEIAKLCQYVSLSDISPSREDLPSSPSISDYLSYLLGHIESHEYKYSGGQVIVNGGDVLVSPGLSQVVLNLANFSASSGWNYNQNRAVVFIPSITSSAIEKSRFSFNNAPSGYDYHLHFDANWDNNIPSSGSVKIEIELVGISSSNDVYFFVHMINGESQ